MQQPNEQIQAAIVSAQKLYTEKDYEKVVDHCTTIIASVPLSAEAFLLRAKAYQGLAQDEEDEELKKEFLKDAFEDLNGYKGKNFKDTIPLTISTRREVAALTKTLNASLRALGVEIDTTPPTSHLSLRSTSSPRSEAKFIGSNTRQQSGIVTDSDRVISAFPSKNSGHGSDLIITASIVSPKDRKASTLTSQQTGQFTIDMSIPHDALTVGKELGQGGFGKVYEGAWREKPVAIKQLLLSKLDQDALSELQKEAQIMFQVASRSDHIVRFKGMVLDREPYSLVMELMPKGSLYQLLKTGQSLPWNIRYRIALDVGYALKDLHPETLHLDLKSMNVLLNEDLRAKITDFGLSRARKKFEESTKGKSLVLSAGVGTSPWMAPELSDFPVRVSAATDIYSFGKVMYELATSQVPPVHGTELFEKTLNDDKQNTPLKETPKEFKTLMFNTWQTSKETRPKLNIITEKLSSLYQASEMQLAGEKQALEATQKTQQQQQEQAALNKARKEVEKVREEMDVLAKQKEVEAQKQKAELEKMRLEIEALKQAQKTIPQPTPLVFEASTTTLAETKTSLCTLTPASSSALTDFFKPKPQTAAIKTSDVVLDEKELSTVLQELRTFLQHVAQGEQDQAQSMLEKNPKLVLGRGIMKEHAERCFESATAFQYAVWAWDWHMWKMIQPYFAKADPTGNAIKAQLLELQTKGLTYTYTQWIWHKRNEQWTRNSGKYYCPGNGMAFYEKEVKSIKETSKYYEFNPLVKAYADYIPIARKWGECGGQSWGPEAEAGYYHYQKVLGGAQRLAPAHVANEHCRRDHPFHPTPKLNDIVALPRLLDLRCNGTWYTNTSPDYELGAYAAVMATSTSYDFGSRSVYPADSGPGWSIPPSGDYLLAIDFLSTCKGIQSLFDIRAQQKEELLSEILPTHTLSPQLTP